MRLSRLFSFTGITSFLHVEKHCIIMVEIFLFTCKLFSFSVCLIHYYMTSLNLFHRVSRCVAGRVKSGHFSPRVLLASLRLQSHLCFQQQGTAHVPYHVICFLFHAQHSMRLLDKSNCLHWNDSKFNGMTYYKFWNGATLSTATQY